MMRTVVVAGFIVAALTGCETICTAQRATHIQLGIGSNLCLVSPRNLNGTQDFPTVAPRADARLVVGLTQRVSFVSGATYEQRAFRSRQELGYAPPNNRLMDVYEHQTRHHLLSIPLQASVRLAKKKAWQWNVDFGMTYSFLLRARGHLDMYSYRNGQQYLHNRFEVQPTISLTPSSGRFGGVTGNWYGGLYLFQPALSASMTVVASQRWVTRLFYEYGLYPIGAGINAANSPRVQTIGVSTGVQL